MITGTSRIRRRDAPLFTRLDDEMLGLDTQAGLAYSLNPSAGRVWELIESWSTIESICTALAQEYEVEPSTCLAEVTALLERLRDASLLDVEDAAAH